MIKLEWQGGIGYGDIVGPISYGHNLSYQLKERVIITLHWKTPFEYVYSDNTPERLYSQAEYINSMCEKSGTDVSLRFIFNSRYTDRFNNYYEEAIYDDPKHNEWIVSDQFKHNPTKGKIVVNSTLENIESFQTYSAQRKKWKDEQKEDWVPLIQNLKNSGYEVVEVGYRTPIRECVEHIRTAEVFLGYHGATLWLARLIGVPSLVTSHGLMRQVFMRAHYCSRINPEGVSEDSFEEYIYMANQRNSFYAYDRDRYKFQNRLLRMIEIL